MLIVIVASTTVLLANVNRDDQRTRRMTDTRASLAEATSLIMLIVFALVNAALIRIKRKDPWPEGLIVFPVIIPLLGLIVSAGFVVSELLSLVGF